MTPFDDDDRTRAMPPRSTAGPANTPSTSTPSEDSLSLPAGAVIGNFEVREKIGEGGFGIVYLAWDRLLHQKVALKEYLPSEIAGRRGTMQVSLRTDRHREIFDRGLESFIDEARRMVQFDHPSLARAITYLEANGTAYIVMPFYEGITVMERVRSMQTPPDENWIKALLRPLTEALAVIHAKDFYHRDIAPDNIILLAGSDRPLLLDFGAARQAFGEKTQALTAILKPGYAPLEQYGEVPGLKQGPWTDIYALAAVVHWIITGKKPPQPVGRMINDTYRPLVTTAAGRYSKALLAGIDQALAVLPEKRTQNIDEFRRSIELDTPLTLSPAPVNPPPAIPDEAPRIHPVPSQVPPSVTTIPAAPVSAAAPLRNRLPLIGGVIIMTLSAATGWWFLHSAPAAPETVPATAVRTSTAEPPQTSAPPAPIAPASAPQPANGTTHKIPEPPTPASVASRPMRNAPRFVPAPQKPVAETPAAGTRQEATEPPRSTPAQNPECANLLARISLGETDADLVSRYRKLGCR